MSEQNNGDNVIDLNAYRDRLAAGQPRPENSYRDPGVVISLFETDPDTDPSALYGPRQKALELYNGYVDSMLSRFEAYGLSEQLRLKAADFLNNDQSAKTAVYATLNKQVQEEKLSGHYSRLLKESYHTQDEQEDKAINKMAVVWAIQESSMKVLATNLLFVGQAKPVDEDFSSWKNVFNLAMLDSTLQGGLRGRLVDRDIYRQNIQPLRYAYGIGLMELWTLEQELFPGSGIADTVADRLAAQAKSDLGEVKRLEDAYEPAARLLPLYASGKEDRAQKIKLYSSFLNVFHA